MDGLTDHEVLHPVAFHGVSELHTILQLDDKRDKLMHAVVQDLQTAR